jgi:type VI secretion system protein ImpH
MASPGGRPTPGVIDELERSPVHFDFFQAVRLLEQAARERGVEAARVGYDTAPAREAVRFRSLPSLGFPASAIHDLRFDDDPNALGPPEMRVTFLGSIGAVGVLPHHYTELLIQRLQLRDTSLRDFLDAFHHRAISFFYRAWCKYRPPAGGDRPDRSSSRDLEPFLLALHSFVGLGTEGLRDRLEIDDRARLFHGGHFSRSVRSAIGLQSLLTDLFAFPFRVEQFVGRWLHLDESNRSRLTRPISGELHHQRLGGEFILGSRVWDVQSKIRLHAGPLTMAEYESLMEGTPGRRRLDDIIAAYVGPNIDFALRFTLKREEACPARLVSAGRERYGLGRSTWLRSSPDHPLPRSGSISLEGRARPAEAVT